MSNNILTPSDILERLDGLTGQTRSNGGLLLIKLHGLERIGRIIGVRESENIISDIYVKFRGAIHQDDDILRTGRFEFIILLKDILNQGHAILAANKIAGLLEQPVVINNLPRKHPFSIGAALTPKNTQDPEELFKFAELAAVSAQRTNVQYQLYSPGEIADVVSDWDIEGELEKAATNDELSLYYQPQIAAETGELKGAEALMRWNHPVHGMVQPGKFIPIAERIGIMPKLTWWCLNTALRELQSINCKNGRLTAAINISAADLADQGFTKAVADAIGIWNIEPHLLTLEITESSVMKDLELSARILDKIRTKGVKISIDDFGTGYSSLAYFRQLPVDELKIDRSFITNILESELDLHVVKTIIEMARALDLNIVAEGVESKHTKQILTKMGCRTIQGFYYSTPLPLEDFIAWVDSYQSSNY